MIKNGNAVLYLVSVRYVDCFPRLCHVPNYALPERDTDRFVFVHVRQLTVLCYIE